MGGAGSTRAVVEGGHKFSCEFYKRLAKRQAHDNVFFSPLGVASVLGLIAASAREQTKEQVLDALGQKDIEKLNSAFRDLLEGLIYHEHNRNTAIENVIFLHKRYEVEADFAKVAKKYFHSPIKQVDFSTDQDKALQQVNTWITQATRARIKGFAGNFDRGTALVFVNLVYHRTLWAHRFNPADTQKGDFHLDQNNTVSVSLMSQIGKYRCFYDKTLDCISVGLPYSDKRTLMVIMVPQKYDGLAKVEEKMSQKFLQETISHMKEKREIRVMLPKFELEESYTLVPILEAMGVSHLFASGRADLQNLCKNTTLHVDEVTHKGVLKVSERGEEHKYTSKETKKDIPCVKANRPFIMIIFDKVTGTIYFMGRLVNPSPK